MAYGEGGACIDDTPRLPKPLPRQPPKEPEVDRFDEGSFDLHFINIY